MKTYILSSSRREVGSVNGSWLAFALFLGITLFFALSYIPPWYKNLNVKERVGQILESQSAEGADEDAIAERIADELEKMKVRILAGDIEIEINRTTKFATVRFDWTAVIRYPFLKKHGRMKFHIKMTRRLL